MRSYEDIVHDPVDVDTTSVAVGGHPVIELASADEDLAAGAIAWDRMRVVLEQIAELPDVRPQYVASALRRRNGSSGVLTTTRSARIPRTWATASASCGARLVRAASHAIPLSRAIVLSAHQWPRLARGVCGGELRRGE